MKNTFFAAITAFSLVMAMSSTSFAADPVPVATSAPAAVSAKAMPADVQAAPVKSAAATDAKAKQCKKGKPCGKACIPLSRTCKKQK